MFHAERQKATRQLKKLRKRLLESTSVDEVEALKKQMHVGEVDLNYTQYFPLSETYISLYPPKSSAGAEVEDCRADEGSKPLMWAEVEKSMEEGTLTRLRNRTVTAQVGPPKRTERKNAIPKPKVQPKIDMAGMNRRERRGLNRIKDVGRTKNNSIGFEKNQDFGASQAIQAGADDIEDGGESDGGFFEE